VEPQAPFEKVCPLAGGDEAGRLFFVVLVLDRAEKLLDGVLDRRDAGRAAVLVDDSAHVRATPPHLAEEVFGALELGDEERRIEVAVEGEVPFLLVREVEEVLRVQDADDVVERPAIDRHPRELVLLEYETNVL